MARGEEKSRRSGTVVQWGMHGRQWRNPLFHRKVFHEHPDRGRRASPALTCVPLAAFTRGGERDSPSGLPVALRGASDRKVAERSGKHSWKDTASFPLIDRTKLGPQDDSGKLDWPCLSTVDLLDVAKLEQFRQTGCYREVGRGCCQHKQFVFGHTRRR